MRYRYDDATGKLITAAEAIAKQPRPPRSNLACPAVHGSMPPIKSMIDGRIYDSKGEYYKHVEKSGCAIVGFEKEPWVKEEPYKEKEHEADIVADIKRSIEEVGNG